MIPICAHERPGWKGMACELRAGHASPNHRAYRWDSINGAKKYEWEARR